MTFYAFLANKRLFFRVNFPKNAAFEHLKIQCFLDEWNRIKKFSSFSHFDQNRIPGSKQKS